MVRHWELLADLTGEKRDRPNAYIELQKPVNTRFIKYEHVYVASHNLAISDIRVFGLGDGKTAGNPGAFQGRTGYGPAQCVYLLGSGSGCHRV